MRDRELYPRLVAAVGELPFPVLFWVRRTREDFSVQGSGHHLHHVSCPNAKASPDLMVDATMAALGKASCCFEFKSLYDGSVFASSLDAARFLEGCLARIEMAPESLGVRDVLFFQAMLGDLEVFSSTVPSFMRLAASLEAQVRVLLEAS